MKAVLKEIVGAIQQGKTGLDDAWLSKLLRKHNRMRPSDEPALAKRQLRPYYLQLKKEEPELLAKWGVSETCERSLLRLLQIKPRRTASGLATVTLVTKPHRCSSDCLYCPSDLRMPKSYLPNEPACRRAEQNYFDPYLQTRSRLRALELMGHIVDKVELIILGGSWNDYPLEYQLWFVTEVFRALNEHGLSDSNDTEQPSCPWSRELGASIEERRAFYEQKGISADATVNRERCLNYQSAVNAGKLNYNTALAQLLEKGPWSSIAALQRASQDDLFAQQRLNEHAACRSVGLCIETRPDLISDESARVMRSLGCTKIQMGIQSLDQDILAINRRAVDTSQIADAFSILRLHGFKILVHFMLNLLGSNPDIDREGYRRLVMDPRFCPDEVKLYPCVLVESSQLTREFETGRWQPYAHDELVGLLADCLSITPAYTRISRMIRDIASTDIIAGNKKPNLRQTVEAQKDLQHSDGKEIRQREIATDDVGLSELQLDVIDYKTSVSCEKFCQWITFDGRIAGFLRLSLPKDKDCAMIRELHVYGRVAGLENSELGGNQHLGLGKSLVELACKLAQSAGYTSLSVISAVGTRPYYRELSFEDDGLYQTRQLSNPA